MKKSISNANHYSSIIDSLTLEVTQKELLKTTWLDYLLLMDHSAKKGWTWHNYSQAMVIVLSLFIPVIEQSKLNYNLFSWDLHVVSVLGLIVAALTTLNRQLAFEEKWRHYRRTAEAMRNEGDDFFALSGDYEKSLSHQDAFKSFIKTVTAFKRLEVNTYMEEDRRRTAKNQTGDGEIKS